MLVYCDDCGDSVVSVVCEDGGAQGVPAGEMPLLTLAVLRVGEDGGTSGVLSCRVDGGASVVFVGEKALIASAIPVEHKTGGGADVLYKCRIFSHSSRVRLSISVSRANRSLRAKIPPTMLMFRR